MKFYRLIFFLFLIMPFVSYAKKNEKDSLLEVLKTAKICDKPKIMNDLAYKISYYQPDSGLMLANQALTLAKKCRNKKETGIALYCLGIYYNNASEYDTAIALCNRAKKIFTELQDTHYIINTLCKLSDIYRNINNFTQRKLYIDSALELGQKSTNHVSIVNAHAYFGLYYSDLRDYEKALQFYKISLQGAKKFNRHNQAVKLINNIANLYNSMKKFEQALVYYLENLSMLENSDDKYLIGATYINLGVTYQDLGKIDSALFYYRKAHQLFRQINALNPFAISIHNMGMTYIDKNLHDSAEYYLFKALETRRELCDIHGIASTLDALGNLYIKKGMFDKAESYLYNALSMADSVNDLKKKMNIYHNLYSLYDTLQDYKNALMHYKSYKNLEDSLFTQQSEKMFNDFQVKYETEKKQKENEILRKSNQLQESELKRSKILQIGLYVIIAVVLSFLLLVYRNFRQKKKANILLTLMNEEIQQQKEEILTQNEEILQQKEEILTQAEYLEDTNKELEKKNKQVTDSINYARRIQEALLPAESQIKRHFPESFIFYLPRDIVSGDFYWFAEQGDFLFLAVADCTGHGVPGAFMSMIGNSLLNEIVKERGVNKPSEILSLLNTRVTEALLQGGDEKAQEDGMDITLCRFSPGKKEIVVACASHTALCMEDGKLKILEGDIFSIGGAFAMKKDSQYTEHTLKSHQGFTLYMFSDGYPDQFGGGDDKKFGMKKFRELIASVADKPLEQQQEILHQTFEQWKGSRRQMDDVLVAGLRFAVVSL